MKESLRRLVVASVYVSAVLSLFFQPISRNTQFNDSGEILILAVIVAVGHKLVNWIFQKGE
jgi:hypothetical protein